MVQPNNIVFFLMFRFDSMQQVVEQSELNNCIAADRQAPLLRLPSVIETKTLQLRTDICCITISKQQIDDLKYDVYYHYQK